jgi:hypothetical protein
VKGPWTRWRPAWWPKGWPGHPAGPPAAVSDRQRAEDLVRAIDAGGVPLNPARVNAIARSLGLEVSRHAAMADTVERIRQALRRGA